jgi:hypothetical protein
VTPLTLKGVPGPSPPGCCRAFDLNRAALSFVRDCESAVAIPERMCRPMVDLFRLRLLCLPLDLDPIPLMSTWHLRYDCDPTHVWIRTQVKEVIQMFCGETQ